MLLCDFQGGTFRAQNGYKYITVWEKSGSIFLGLIFLINSYQCNYLTTALIIWKKNHPY